MRKKFYPGCNLEQENTRENNSHPRCNSGMEQDGVENVNFRFVQTGELWADRKDESLEKDDKTR